MTFTDITEAIRQRNKQLYCNHTSKPLRPKWSGHQTQLYFMCADCGLRGRTCPKTDDRPNAQTEAAMSFWARDRDNLYDAYEEETRLNGSTPTGRGFVGYHAMMRGRTLINATTANKLHVYEEAQAA